MYGGAGRDFLASGDGSDSLFGGNGHDTLISMMGNEMTGGAGADVFGVIDNPDDVLADGTDFAGPQEQFPIAVITGFDPSEDVLALGMMDTSVAPSAESVSINVLDDETSAEVLIDGQVVALVIGGQTLSVADIKLDASFFTDDLR